MVNIRRVDEDYVAHWNLFMDEEAYEGDEKDYTTAHWNYMREIESIKTYSGKNFFFKKTHEKKERPVGYQ